MVTRPQPLLTLRADNARAIRAAGSGELRSALAIERTFDRLDRERIGINAAREKLQKWNASARDTLKTVRAQLKKTGGVKLLKKERALKPDVSRLVIGIANCHKELSRLNARRHNWHGSLLEAKRAMGVRKRGGKEFFGSPLGIGPQLYLQAAYARFMLMGNSPALRDELRLALKQYPLNDSLVYWAMRYELMSAHYQEAFTIYEARKALGGRIDSRILNELLPLLDRQQARSPEEAYPCNFYTYRYALFTPAALTTFREELNTAKAARSSVILTLWQCVLNAWQNWSEGNDHLEKRRFSSAEACYEECCHAVLCYFETFDHFYNNGGMPPSDPKLVYSGLVQHARKWFIAAERRVNLHFKHRYQAVTLDQLEYQDWQRPKVCPVGVNFYSDFALGEFGAFERAFTRGFVPFRESSATTTPVGDLLGLNLIGPDALRPDGFVYVSARDKVIEKIHCPLLALGLIHARLAIAEARRARQDHDYAISECERLLKRHDELKLLSQFIEVPFIKILMGQIMIEKGDAQYKRKERSIPGVPNSQLKAFQTYRGALLHFQDQGGYVFRVNLGGDILRDELVSLFAPARHPLALSAIKVTSAQRVELFNRLTQVPVADIHLDRPSLLTAGPHEALLEYRNPDGTRLMGETNPLIYQLVLQARARIRQVEAGLNFLGYADDFVPPWRFTYLLERARYFTNNAKDTQSTYLNFLANAEREEFQELTVAQRVSEERQNIRLEEARIEQARHELEVARESEELAEMTSDHALERQADDDWLENSSSVVAGVGGAIVTGAAVGTAIGGPVGTVVGAIVGAAIGFLVVDQQIDESNELQRGVEEADQAKAVAAAQVDAAIARLEVAVCQMGVALLRHDFAVQVLDFHRRRTLNSENWFRLAFMIRAIADNYLRYAVEVAYLTEQAYEFEADKRMDVIRFDYDLDEVAGLLAADFLRLDLDTLEQDMLTSEQVRLQVLKQTISLARDFPSTLRQLQESGSGDFCVALERLERRFPGIYNLRIGQVEILPIALMDPTGFVVELTQLGFGSVRLKRNTSSPLRPSQGTWAALPNDPLSLLWPAFTHITGPETAVFTGLTRADRDASAPLFSAAERNAFERRPGASAWHIDIDLEENRIVPSSLADVSITFNLTGYYDPILRERILSAPRRLRTLTQAVSAHQVFPDQFYDFKQTGTMLWPVSRELLSLNPPASPVKNLGVVLVPAAQLADHGAILSRHRVVIRLDRNGIGTVVGFIPQFRINIASLTVDFDCPGFPAGGTISWDFGDESPLANSVQVQYTYTLPGQYTARATMVELGRTSEHTFHLNISDSVDLDPPFVAFPNLTFAAPNPGLTRLTCTLAGARLVDSISARLIGVKRGIRFDEGNRRVTIDLPVDSGMDQEFELELLCIRQLSARITGDQGTGRPGNIVLDRLKAGSDFRFQADGSLVPGSGTNAFSAAVMGNSLTPADRWRLILDTAANSFLSTHLPNRPDLRQIADARILLQFDTR